MLAPFYKITFAKNGACNCKTVNRDGSLITKLKLYLFHDGCLHGFLMEYYTRKHHPVGGFIKLFKMLTSRINKTNEITIIL